MKTEHNLKTFCREYLLARKIPYKFFGDQLVIDKKVVIFCIYNFTFKELIECIDRHCGYNDFGYYQYCWE